jgi:Putative restriction endonuclease
VWQEGLAPFLMVELLSPGTEAEDLGSAARVSPEVASGACPARQTLRVIGKPPTKWQVYEQVLRVPYYAVFDRYTNQFRVFCLQGVRYAEVTITGQGFWFPELELGLGVWQGIYAEVEGLWLRWYDSAGNWVPTMKDRVIQESQRADQESRRADSFACANGDQEQQRAKLSKRTRNRP